MRRGLAVLVAGVVGALLVGLLPAGASAVGPVVSPGLAAGVAETVVVPAGAGVPLLEAFAAGGLPVAGAVASVVDPEVEIARRVDPGGVASEPVRADAPSALEAARTLEEQVEDVSQRSAGARVLANPDGEVRLSKCTSWRS